MPERDERARPRARPAGDRTAPARTPAHAAGTMSPAEADSADPRTSRSGGGPSAAPAPARRARRPTPRGAPPARGGTDAGASGSGSARARRHRTEAEVGQLVAELDALVHHLQTAPLTDPMQCVELYATQKACLATSLTLLDVLEAARRTTHTRQLPELHTVLRRLWHDGIEAPLARLTAALAAVAAAPPGAAAAPTDGTSPVPIAPFTVVADALESMLCHTYATCANTYERATELRVRRACVEWLGDLASRQLVFLHYVHAAHLDTEVPHDTRHPRGRSARRAIARPVAREELEAWHTTADTWYGAAIRAAPHEGHLYTALAQLAGPHELRALYYACKSVQVVHPSADARALLRGLGTRAAQAHRTRPDATVLELLVAVHVALAGAEGAGGAEEPPDGAPAAVLTALARASERFCARGSGMAYAGTRFPHMLRDTDWMMLGVTSVAALFAFGHPDAYVDIRELAAYRTPSRARLFSEPHAARVAARLAAAPAPPPDGDPAGCVDAALARGVPWRCACALQLLAQLIHVAAQLQHEALENRVAHINAPTAFLVIVFTALHILALRAHTHRAAHTLLDVLRAHMAWTTLEAFARVDVLDPAPLTAPGLFARARRMLPEDWCLRGIAWNTYHPAVRPDPPPGGGPAAAPAEAVAGGAAFAYDSEAHMFAELGARTRYYASLKTHSYLSAYVQDPDLQALLRDRHARFHLLHAALRDALDALDAPAR
ncbi:hypothetical protein MBRA1_003879 [Malassezia brasiliensis]|uniref:Uncharacterized protein n=1 Tax=Malassezia brasiliensis TaxID=1821822 RepID=A0AAF0DW90_9BASI|nr:hypothetical protein MBRA1_003879 [Malassezia brasiliensis]